MTSASHPERPPSTVAVVIPCYQQGHFLADAIESVLAQDRPVDQLIVVNDGSTDETEQIAARYPSVRCITQPNAGLARARNRGLAETKADFIAFVDADDRLLPHAIRLGVEALDAEFVRAFVWGFNRPINASGEPIGEVSNPYEGKTSFAALLSRNIVGPPVGVLFRRAVVERAGGFSPEPEAVEDYDLYLRVAHVGTYHCLGEVTAEYRYHGANMSSDPDRMLRASRWIYDRQAPSVRGDASLEAALAEGRRDAELRYDASPRFERFTNDLKRHEWRKGLRDGFGLFRDYPMWFLRSFFGRLRASR